MGRLTSAVHWWEESQMRALVLGSLVVQLLLLIFTFLRRRAIPGWIRFLMWLAYLGCDAIAIYALATLFNRHKAEDRGGGSTLEVVWAPILLIHLGGHDGITAYNIEDNELWSRHLLTTVSQVTVAIYVFCKSWPPGGDRRLLQASILLFVPGILKCFTKPWALKRASITSLVSSPAANRTAKKDKVGKTDLHTLEKYVKRAKAFVQVQKDEDNEARPCVENDGHPPPQQDGMDPFEEYVDEMNPLEDYLMERARDFVNGEQKHEVIHRWLKERSEQVLRHEAYKLFVDLSSPYAGHRLSIFKYFWVISQEKLDKAGTAYGYVRGGLASAFLLLYTKLKTAGISMGSDDIADMGTLATFMIGFICCQLIQISRMVLPWAAIGLFHRSHREAYNDTDVKITYALLCCTAVLETYSNIPIAFTETHTSIGRERWPETVAQYSLIGYFARNKNHSKKMRILSNLGCKDLVDQRWCMEPCFSSRVITELVLGYLKDGWREKIQDVTSYHSFIDNRGHWALEGKEDLSWSIKEPFDESVILWHIATDFCFFLSPFTEHRCPRKAVQCRQISNYMMYLLFANPEMLLPGTRRNLFNTAYNDLKYILRDNKLNPQSCCQKVEEKDLMETLLKTMRDKSNKEDHKEESKEGQTNGGSQENFIDDAWDLAQGLLKLMDDFGEEKMWEVIQGVWVEMLCFSASRCRGYLHAKALGSGGEFLSYIWLLLFYMGMETFTERLQREKGELQSREANNNDAPPVSYAHNGSGTVSSSGSRICNREAPSPSHLHTGMSSTSSSDEIQMANMV